MKTAPFRTGHHAVAYAASGRSLPDKIWGWDMPVLADFPGRCAGNRCGAADCRCDCPWPADNGLSQAQEWGRQVIADDSRVATVAIIESVQDYEGCSWRVTGRTADTIRRQES